MERNVQHLTLNLSAISNHRVAKPAAPSPKQKPANKTRAAAALARRDRLIARDTAERLRSHEQTAKIPKQQQQSQQHGLPIISKTEKAPESHIGLTRDFQMDPPSGFRRHICPYGIPLTRPLETLWSSRARVAVAMRVLAFHSRGRRGQQ
ncbi:uncharacterized protein LTR77_002713 [Saxophila tyrrhenica]|uniref:Uncharacterized protein n=1 Tax=Saxophila tyrrhenica TaxID=1690608 RepID=A0AAV9PJK3_9PEZI|nr:hypothetical protein LTR77_002713 [Saxophila tyrrhenica]